MFCYTICFVWIFLHDWAQVKQFWQEYYIGVLCTTHCITPGSTECSFVLLFVMLLLITWQRWCHQISALPKTLYLSKLINNLVLQYAFIASIYNPCLNKLLPCFPILAFPLCVLVGILIIVKRSFFPFSYWESLWTYENYCTVTYYRHCSFWCSYCPRFSHGSPFKSVPMFFLICSQETLPCFHTLTNILGPFALPAPDPEPAQIPFSEKWYLENWVKGYSYWLRSVIAFGPCAWTVLGNMSEQDNEF